MQNGQDKTQTGRLDRRTVLHNRYMILQTVGQGGMGAVYKAQDMKRRSIVAIKEMSLSMVPPEERDRAIRNFETESNILGTLRHPNLPAFTGRFTEDARHFLVMEFIDGQTLEDLLERNNGPFPERRVLGWARQLSDVLAYLHSQTPPIIFRDLKPGNIMLTRDGRLKLIDFGIARFFRAASAVDTQILGTPGYAPPEQYGKAQTDARSDIYSLSMALFHLMTNTLSEKGFGLKNVHETYPQISLPVARALEKAAALAPEDRFQTAEAFRRALLGEGTFLFEHGDQATSPEELAELCARFPEEATEYLYSGEIEAWFQDIGRTNLARAAQRIRENEGDALRAVEMLLQAILGPNARIRQSILTSTVSKNGAAAPSSRGLFRRVPATDIIVQPLIIDFGEVFPGLSEPMALTVSGNKGLFVQGSLAASEPWIIVDKASFDGMNTRINVRVDTTGLFESRRYTGSIIVMPAEEDDEHDITVSVRVGVLGASDYGAGAQGLSPDEDASTLVTGAGKAAMAQRSGAQTQAAVPANASQQPVRAVPASAQNYHKARFDEDQDQYGPPTANTRTPGTRNAPSGSARQRFWQRLGLTALAAVILASLVFIVLALLPVGGQAGLSSPRPWLIVALIAALPAAALGAYIPNWQWDMTVFRNRLCTSMSAALLVVGLGSAIWHILLRLGNSPEQLIVMLLLIALGTTSGHNAAASERILKYARLYMRVLARFTITFLSIIGGLLGIALALGYLLSLFTFAAILAGIIIALALAFQADALNKRQRGRP